jgi:hypothetical protein
MKGFVELTEVETKEVKGGFLFFTTFFNGFISIVQNLIPAVKSIIGDILTILE